MSTQPEALRLADALIHRHGAESFEGDAAAELRRLHAENRLLHERHHDDNVEYTRVLAQRDALLGLLKEARKIAPASSSRNLAKDWDQRTTAAIKSVEGEKG